jgi:hypothetical protein
LAAQLAPTIERIERHGGAGERERYAASLSDDFFGRLVLPRKLALFQLGSATWLIS